MVGSPHSGTSAARPPSPARARKISSPAPSCGGSATLASRPAARFRTPRLERRRPEDAIRRRDLERHRPGAAYPRGIGEPVREVQHRARREIRHRHPLFDDVGRRCARQRQRDARRRPVAAREDGNDHGRAPRTARVGGDGHHLGLQRIAPLATPVDPGRDDVADGHVRRHVEGVPLRETRRDEELEPRLARHSQHRPCLVGQRVRRAAVANEVQDFTDVAGRRRCEGTAVSGRHGGTSRVLAPRQCAARIRVRERPSRPASRSRSLSPALDCILPGSRAP